jgi:hypothetical protein
MRRLQKAAAAASTRGGALLQGLRVFLLKILKQSSFLQQIHVREVVGVAGGEVAGLEQVGAGGQATLWGGAKAMGLMTLATIKTTFHWAIAEEEEEEEGGEGEGDGGQAEVAAGKRLRVGTSSFKTAGLVDEVAAAVQEEEGGRGPRKVDGVEVRV